MNTLNTLQSQIADIVAEVAEVALDQVQLGRSLRDIGVDSLMSLEIAMHVEHQLHISFLDGELRGIQTFDDFVAITQSALSRITNP